MRWLADEIVGHPIRTAIWSARIARRLGWGWTALLLLVLAALLHDFGKLVMPRGLLHKAGALQPDERAVVRQHPLHGYAWLFFAPRAITGVILYHHECWDGSGYPLALRGGEIPLAARIVAVADVYDALTSARPYKPAWGGRQATDHIVGGRGRQFDPRVVAAFMTLVDEAPLAELYPAGTPLAESGD